MLVLICNRNVTWLRDSSAFAGQEKPNLLFLTCYETHSETAQIQRPAAEVGRAVVPVLSEQCQAGRADISSKYLQRAHGAYNRAGLDMAGVFASARDPQLALLGVCWPEEYKITFFSQGSCPPGDICSLVQRNISKRPRSFLLQI